MTSSPKSVSIEQPRLINALTAGFNSIANHAVLILVPAVLDILLWFTPRLRVDGILLPWVDQFIAQFQQISGSSQEMTSVVGTYLRDLVQNLNLTGAIRSFPVGIPSLLAGLGESKSPLGEVPVFQIASLGQAVLIVLILFILGIILGSLFFIRVASITQDSSRNYNPRRMGWKIGQSLILTTALFIILAVAIVPGMMIVSLVSLINSLLGQVAFFFYLFLVFWFAVPWFYAYHGIFVFGLPAVNSVMLSLRVGRMFISKTASLILIIGLISQGLNLLWATPPVSSWLLLIGIAGHAFVSTGLISTTIVYFRQINRVLAMLIEMQQNASRTA